MTDDKAVAEIKKIFGGVVPQVFAVMAEKGILQSAWPLLKESLVDDDGIENRSWLRRSQRRLARSDSDNRYLRNGFCTHCLPTSWRAGSIYRAIYFRGHTHCRLMAL